MTARGRLRVLLGYSRGIGTTYAMLEEGRRLRDQGRDVVVAALSAHGRAPTIEAARRLDAVTPVPERGRDDGGPKHAGCLDVDATMARHPDVALVDELARGNPVGGRHLNRWQDVERLLSNGIDVISTLTIGHIESLSGTVARITETPEAETIPDAVLRSADQIEVVDVSPQAVDDRLAAGLIGEEGRSDPAADRRYRPERLTALRELALLWVADDAEAALQKYREQHDQASWQTRERVVVGLSGGPRDETLLHRGARIASGSAGARLLAVHVTGGHRPHPDTAALARNRVVAERLGAGFHQVVGNDVPGALIDFAHSVDATQLVVGAGRQSRAASILHPGVGERAARRADGVDVRIVTHPASGEGTAPLPRSTGALSPRRQVAGLAAALVAGPPLTWLLVAGRLGGSITVDALAFQLLVVVVALVGGIWPALFAAVGLGITLDYFFIAPLHTVAINSAGHLATVVLYAVVAALVSLVVDRAARQTRVARRSAAESQLLQSISSSVLGGQDAVQTLVDQTREAFGMGRVRLVRDGTDVASSTARPPGGAPRRARAGEWARLSEPVGQRARLELEGPALGAGERRLLSVIAVQLATALEQADLSQAAASDKVRTALLSALGHDLRRPLAAATAAVSGLRAAGDELGDADRAELVETADQSLAALSKLIDDLLDVRRLEAGALSVFITPTETDDVIEAALDEIGAGPDQVRLDIDPGMPTMLADPTLLRRVLVNLLNNALRHRPQGTAVQLSAGAVDDRVELRVADHGPGIDPRRRDAMFVPFQRLGDTDNTTGLGLGLALSKGFVEGMGGTLTPEDTSGGGLTMVVSLPRHRHQDASQPEGPGSTGRKPEASHLEASQ